MITATQAVEISNTNADQIERVLDQKSEFWKKVKKELDEAMHHGKREVSIVLEPSNDLANIYTVLRYNGYKLKFFRLFPGNYMNPGVPEPVQGEVLLNPKDYYTNPNDYDTNEGKLLYLGDFSVEVSW
jgi:hypothetical protein